ncbi:hypothetical protein BDW74DRAFT_143874 [Aspergillus multicolor]|uniref:uncharacterized protein n=1 Tax=Aspergillus multicolor TaxID=41759 RepID=UPI003CCDA59D
MLLYRRYRAFGVLGFYVTDGIYILSLYMSAPVMNKFESFVILTIYTYLANLP